MNRDMTFNFSAGPSMLPTAVLEQAAAEMLNYRDTGESVMEMSHRSREYQDIFDHTKAALKETLSVPDSHEILFLQGGASMQFSAIPLNLTAEGDSVDYAVTGNFSKLAAKEAKRYCTVNLAADMEPGGFDFLREVYLPQSVETIGRQAFQMSMNLERIHLPAGLKEIGEKAFARCYSLKQVDVPANTVIGWNAFFMTQTKVVRLPKK